MTLTAAPPVSAAPPSHAPRAVPWLVARPRLIRRLTAARDLPVALLAAPSGYGKTTLLTEWSIRDDRPFAWVEADADADDPGHLATLVASALEERGLESAAGPFVLAVDDAHRIASPESTRLLGDLARRLPVGSTLALASRGRLGLPVGRLRAHRLALELGARDLAMTRLEAAMLLDAGGLRLGAEQVDHLVGRTAGWPVGLYLAALSIDEQDDVESAVGAFAGSDRLVADYLRDELLADLPGEWLAFLRRTSVLTRLTPSLCDAVLRAGDSAAVLRALSRGNLLIEPLDRCDSEFRYHPLLAEMLQAELARLEPEVAPALHRRAADWHARRGDEWTAVRHAAAAGDADRAGRLLWSLAPRYAGRGETAAVAGWIGRFRAAELSAHPELALAAATCDLADGRRDPAERWTAAAERALHERGDRQAVGAVALLRACIARRGVRRMAEDAARACALAPPDSPWSSAGQLIAGVAHHLVGDRDTARTLLEAAVRGSAAEMPLAEAHGHSQLGLLAAEREDWDDAAWRVDDAVAALERVSGRAALRALPLAVCAAVTAHAGDVDEARVHAAGAGTLLPSLAGFAPWYVAETHVWLARAEIRLSDAATARRLLARAAREQRQAPDAAVLWQWLHDAWERADAYASGSTGDGPSLTNAELRVLRFLPTCLSFREMGVRLHVSPNTIKTQALAVYRKLEVGCRSDAVARARSVGLIDD